MKAVHQGHSSSTFSALAVTAIRSGVRVSASPPGVSSLRGTGTGWAAGGRRPQVAYRAGQYEPVCAQQGRDPAVRKIASQAVMVSCGCDGQRVRRHPAQVTDDGGVREAVAGSAAIEPSAGSASAAMRPSRAR